jgi:WD40 repeat protein
VAWSPDGARLATASDDGTARVWDARSGREALVLRGHGGPVLSVAWSPDGARLATTSGDGTARVWDARSGQQALVLRGHGAEVYSVAWSPDGSRLATASWDNTARVWDARSGQEARVLRGHRGPVYAVSWSPDGSRLATASEDARLASAVRDGTARVWDAPTGQLALELRGPRAEGHLNSIISSVCWSPDGARLAAASYGTTARVWDARSGQLALELKGHGGRLTSVAWSPDGSRLATASWDNTARVWDARSGQETLALRGPVGDARAGQEALALRGPGGNVLGVAFSPDGGRLVTASADGTARVWDARTGKVAAGSYDLWAEDEARRRAWAADWHADDAEAAAKAGDGFALAFHVGWLRRLEPASPAQRLRRGLALLRLGYRTEGLADLAHPDAARGADFGTLHCCALACLASGDRAGYRAACAGALGPLGKEPDPRTANDAAWVCCLGPGGADDPGAVVALAERAVAGQPGDYASLNTLGAALMRASRHEEAVRRLGEALKLRDQQQQVLDELLLALACQKLGRPDEARRWLDKAQTWMDRYRAPARALGTLGAGPAGPLPAMAALVADRPDPRAAGSDYDLQNWLEMEVLRAEAEAALAGPAPRP